MNISNCYEAALQLFELSEELTALFDQKEKEKDPRTNEILDSKIDNVEAEFLWDKFPGFGVYRNIRSNKWFGIIMNIPKNKIVGDDEKEIEVLNVNLDLASSIYLKQKGIYPSYHMNKKNWVSIILDDTLKDEDIMKLIQIM